MTARTFTAAGLAYQAKSAGSALGTTYWATMAFLCTPISDSPEMSTHDSAVHGNTPQRPPAANPPATSLTRPRVGDAREFERR
jgi:hypothetical protein